MSETITYQCPNCGGGLKFDPEKQNYVCEYCLSEFTQMQLDAVEPVSAAAGDASGGGTAAGDVSGGGAAAGDASGGGAAVLYTCPSCGAQIVTDETTAASFCYYCHNPVILTGRLSGTYHPDYVIPFAVPKEKALEIFSQWMKRKRYVPKSFYSEEQIQKLTGVYFPYLMYSCKVDGRLDAKADRLRIWVSGNYQYTETSTYDVSRKGTMEVKHVPRGALKKANRQLAEGVFPFDMSGLEPFSMGYLSGFMAERRDIETQELEAEVRDEVEDYAKESLKANLPSYDHLRVESSDAVFHNGRWEYALLPVWTLTYREQAKDKVYYFTINGQNGKVCGVLPVDIKRLAILFAEIFFPILLIMLFVGYML